MSLESNKSQQKDSGRSGNFKKQRTKLEALRIRNDIRRLKIEGKNPDEICKTLDLTKSNYWYYCSQLQAEDKAELKRERTDLLAHEIMLTKYRLENTISVTTTILDDASLPVKDRIEAGRLLQETSLNIIRLIVDGPTLVGVEMDPSHSEPEDLFPTDEFIAFAERTSNEKFQRPKPQDVI
ncbi:hypothetical protein [Candidatus Nitrosotenuis aquarius]|uniref:hypothetical protein n=1 Tax=Candidatus Nitrosotenuis aquarius TaxID=1846278 RepID=UPI000C1E7076|nr:hypothetical protein [Candidatus Nitrosotenuis aquarius]